MIEALTIIKEQTEKFEQLVTELENKMNSDSFVDGGDMLICERLLQDHYEYLFSLNTKYELIQDLYRQRAN